MKDERGKNVAEGCGGSSPVGRLQFSLNVMLQQRAMKADF